MRILLALDGSPCSQAAVDEVARRTWPIGTEVYILSVAHGIPVIPDPALAGVAAHIESLEEERQKGWVTISDAAAHLNETTPDLKVTKDVVDGSPTDVILQEAERFGADLILVGSHGRGALKRFLLGSVSQAVAQHAKCSVEIVRCREAKAA